MYLNIGNDMAVRDTSVIGIFDMDNTSTSKRTRSFLDKAEKSGSKVGSAFSSIAKGAVAMGAAVVTGAAAVGTAAYGMAMKTAEQAVTTSLAEIQNARNNIKNVTGKIENPEQIEE